MFIIEILASKRFFVTAIMLSQFVTTTMAIKWEKFHEEDGIVLFKAPENKNGIIPFKAEAFINNYYLDILKVLVDSKRKPNWAPKLKDVKIHKKKGPGAFIFSEYYSTPWPATDREFLLYGKVIFPSSGLANLYAVSSLEDRYAHEDYIQCDIKFININLYRVSKTKTKISFSFLGDMNGWMPAWLINIIQKKWPLRFIQGLKKELKEKGPRVTDEYMSLKRVFPKILQKDFP